MPFGLGFFATAGAAAGGGAAFELIQTTVLTSAQANVTFSSIPSTYTHLQLRIVARSARTTGNDEMYARFNSDANTNYSIHRLIGNGSSVSSFGQSSTSYVEAGYYVDDSGAANAFGASIMDIYDYQNTTKNKTTKHFIAQHPGNRVQLYSGNWRNTAAITSIQFYFASASNILTNSRFSLYGLRG